MRRYETIFIIDNDLSEEDRSPIFDRLKDLMEQHHGFLVTVDEWGSKKLAYEIKKKARGYYVRLDYCGSGILVNEMERFFRIDDRILKFMTVLLDKDVDIETVKEEIARAEELKAAQTETSDAQPISEPSDAHVDEAPDTESKDFDHPETETT